MEKQGLPPPLYPATPNSAQYVSPRPPTRYQGKSALVLSSLQVVGAILILLFSLGVFIPVYDEVPGAIMIKIGFTVFFLIITGGIGIGAAKKQSKCLIITHMVFCILACLCVVGVIAISIYGVTAGAYAMKYDDDYGNYGYNRHHGGGRHHGSGGRGHHGGRHHDSGNTEPSYPIMQEPDWDNMGEPEPLGPVPAEDMDDFMEEIEGEGRRDYPRGEHTEPSDGVEDPENWPHEDEDEDEDEDVGEHVRREMDWIREEGEKLTREASHMSEDELRERVRGDAMHLQEDEEAFWRRRGGRGGKRGRMGDNMEDWEGKDKEDWEGKKNWENKEEDWEDDEWEDEWDYEDWDDMPGAAVWCYENYDYKTRHQMLTGFSVMVMLLAIFEFIITIWGSGLACKVTCCATHSNPVSPSILYVESNKAPFPVVGATAPTVVSVDEKEPCPKEVEALGTLDPRALEPNSPPPPY